MDLYGVCMETDAGGAVLGISFFVAGNNSYGSRSLLCDRQESIVIGIGNAAKVKRSCNSGV